DLRSKLGRDFAAYRAIKSKSTEQYLEFSKSIRTALARFSYSDLAFSLLVLIYQKTGTEECKVALNLLLKILSLQPQ
ncbi:MAG: hypothetical protein ACRDEA_08390, partial [Microcystaceae cyanobacterium]